MGKLQNKKTFKGFTVVELVIVIAIIAVLVAVIVPTFASVINNAKMVARYSKASNARNEYFYENKSTLDTWADMKDYLIYVDGQTLYEIDEKGDIVLSNLDIEECVEDGDYVEISRPYTNDDLVIMYQPSGMNEYSRAVRARNNYRRLKNIDRSYYEMSNYIILVSDDGGSSDVYYRVNYVGPNSALNGMLEKLDKDFSGLALEGKQYIQVSEGNDKFSGIVYSPDNLTQLRFRFTQVDSELYNITHNDENIKEGDYIYCVDNNLYQKNDNGLIVQINSQETPNKGVSLVSYNEIEDSKGIMEQGYQKIYTSVIDTDIMAVITEESSDSVAYHSIECYGIRYGFYDVDDEYHTWEEYREIYDSQTAITEITSRPGSDFSGIKKIILSDTVTTLDYDAFGEYEDLETIILPQSLTTVTANPLTNGVISEIIVHQKNNIFTDYLKKGLVKMTGVTRQLVSATSAMLDDDNKLPQDITSLGAYAFENTDITQINITGYAITDGLFKNCDTLTQVTYTLTEELPDEMFSGCVLLEEVSVYSGLERIGADCFKNCNTIMSINLPATLNHIGEGAFDGTTMTLYYADSKRTFETEITNEADLSDLTILYALKDITYSLGSGILNTNVSNPTKFDPDSTTYITLYAPIISNRYVFVNYSVAGTYSTNSYANINATGDPLNPYRLMPYSYDEDITLTANYEFASRSFAISYYIDDVDRTEDIFGDGELEFSYEGNFQDSYNASYTDDIVVPLITKTGFTFDGWYMGGILIDNEGTTFDQYGREGDVILTSTFNIITYSINYNYNEGTVETANPTSYTVETPDFTLVNPTRPDYDFIGYKIGSAEPQKPVTISVGSTGNRIYEAIFTPTVYTISYELNDGIVSTPNATEFTILTDDITLVAPTKRGYTFTGYNDGLDNIGTTFECSEYHSNVTLTATYSVNSYTLTYSTNHITSNTNPAEYTFGTIVNLVEPEVSTGYTFNYWTESHGYVINDILSGADGNLTIVANITPIQYNITYNLYNGTNNNQNPSQYNIESSITILGATKEGYQFAGWTGSNGSNPALTITILPGATGNKTYTANWSLIIYEIEYDLDGGEVEIDNPTQYNYESEEITLNNPTKEGYDFKGWTGTDLTSYTMAVVIPVHSTGARSYVANYNVIGYAITYELNGGTVENENPDTYNVISGTFTLNNPTKLGYTFTGWSGTGIDGTSTTVTIIMGETGERSYTAHYSIIDYTLTYNLNDGSIASANPVSYNILSDEITLNNPTKTGYNFIGWSGTDINGTSTEVVIPTGSIGNREFTANYSTIGYSISYTLNGGTVAGINTTSYNIESNAIQLINPTKTGYTFDGWSGTDITGTSTNVVIPTGSTGNRAFTANFTIIVYTISYELNGGDVATANPTSYTVETSLITLNNPTKTGYDFAGWTGTDITTPLMQAYIFKGSTGNREYTATYQTISYTITYNLGGGATDNPTSYNAETPTFSLTDAYKNGYTFNGWSGTGLNEITKNVTITLGSTGHKTFTANYTVITYTIGYNLNNGTVNGTNPTSYTIESALISIINPTKTGYTFAGWSGYDIVTTSLAVTIPSGSTGNRNYTANFNVITYTISYELNGGFTYDENPTSYTIESSSITISNPMKVGSTFTGWSGTGINGTTTTLTIPTGSTGSKSFTANFELTNYTLTYELNGGNTTNPATYTIETPTFTLNNPSKLAYDFDGWLGTDVNTKSTSVSIVNGSTGDRSFTAYWTPITYTISYDLAGGTAGASMPTSFTIESEDLSVSDPTRTGYNFNGWSGTLSGTELTIPTGSYGNISLTAIWVARVYSVVVTPNGVGQLVRGDRVFFRNTYNSSVKVTGTRVYGANSEVLAPSSARTIYYNYLAASTGIFDESAYSFDAMSYVGPQSSTGSYAITNGVMLTFSDVQTISAISYRKQTGSFQNFVVYDSTTGNAYYCSYFGMEGDFYLYQYTMQAFSFPAVYDQILTSPIPRAASYGQTFNGYYCDYQYYNSNGVAVRTMDVAGTLYLTPSFSIAARQVTLNKNNGVGGTDVISVMLNDPMPYAVAPTRDGYRFDGYFYGSTQYYYPNMTSARNWDLPSVLSISARWTALTYTLYLYKNDGTNSSTSITVNLNETVPNVPVPTRDYYTFAGYYRESSGGGTCFYNSSGVGQVAYTDERNIGIYAKWIETYNPSKGATEGSYDSNYVSGEFPYQHHMYWYRTGYDYSCTTIHYSVTLNRADSNTRYAQCLRGSTVSLNGGEIYYLGSNIDPYTSCTNGKEVMSGDATIWHSGVTSFSLSSYTRHYSSSWTPTSSGSGSWTVGGTGA